MNSPLHDTAWWTPERRAVQSVKVAAGHHRRSRLSWADVRKIRAAHKRGETNETIASWYGMHFANIACITRNFTWHDPAYEPRLTRVCALPSCGAEFTTMNVAQRFCDPKHRRLHNQRVKQGYYSRRLVRCIVLGRRAGAHERARCACTRCVEVLMALADDALDTIARKFADVIDYDDGVQLARAHLLTQVERFAAKPHVSWGAFANRAAHDALAAEHGRQRTLKRGGGVVTLRLDQPLGDDDGAALGSLVAASGRDPLDELAHRRAAAALGDLTLADVERLTPLGLARLRERLRREGVTPSMLEAA